MVLSSSTPFSLADSDSFTLIPSSSAVLNEDQDHNQMKII